MHKMSDVCQIKAYKRLKSLAYAIINQLLNRASKKQTTASRYHNPKAMTANCLFIDNKRHNPK